MTVSVHEAKTHLSKYLAEVENGLEIVISRGKKPVVMTISKVAGRGSFGFHFSEAVSPLAGKVGRFFETAIKTINAMPTAVLQHVAAALESGCKQFASLDARQRECARLEKLELHPAVFPRGAGIRKS